VATRLALGAAGVNAAGRVCCAGTQCSVDETGSAATPPRAVKQPAPAWELSRHATLEPLFCICGFHFCVAARLVLSADLWRSCVACWPQQLRLEAQPRRFWVWGPPTSRAAGMPQGGAPHPSPHGREGATGTPRTAVVQASLSKPESPVRLPARRLAGRPPYGGPPTLPCPTAQSAAHSSAL